MSAGAVRDALLRAVLARPIIADTTEDVRTFWSNASAAKCRARRFRPRCRRSSRRDWCTNRDRLPRARCNAIGTQPARPGSRRHQRNRLTPCTSATAPAVSAGSARHLPSRFPPSTNGLASALTTTSDSECLWSWRSCSLLPRCLAWVVTTVRAWQPMFFGSAERRFSVPA